MRHDADQHETVLRRHPRHRTPGLISAPRGLSERILAHLATTGLDGSARWVDGSIAETLSRKTRLPTLFVPATGRSLTAARPDHQTQGMGSMAASNLSMHRLWQRSSSVVKSLAPALALRLTGGTQNMTVNLVPWPLSPGTNCNMPPICFASASTIFIPRLLHAAGSNPAGNPGPASKTDNE
jgi:hypothetical protein